MAEANSSPPEKPASAEEPDEPPVIEPLTRGGYKRLPAAEQQIAGAATLETAALVERAQQRDETALGYLSAEALVYFIRRADRNDDRKTRDALFRELFERCTPFFRGKFRGFSREVREDIQGDVMNKVVEDLLAPDDRGDFMQVRFWSYLDRRRIDACRVAFRHADDTESLDAGYSSEGESEGRTKLETLSDSTLSPEELAILSDALEKLPSRLRHVYLLRHYVGMKIGSDDPADDAQGELTLAGQFGRSGRTIRNWLKEADRLLAGFQEKHDDGK